MRPRIGVLPLYDSKKQTLWINPLYFGGVEQAGGLPLLLPLSEDPELWDEYLESCDGFVFTGGQDIAPGIYGEETLPECGYQAPLRDNQEQYMLERLMGMDKPVLGICRGIQLINVLLGGTLYQDLDSEHPSSVEHHMLPPYNRTVHRVTLEPGILSSLIREWEFGVNSYHHQAICRLAPVLHTEAVSQDGLIEGVSCPDMRFLLAVQWHPELIYREDPRNFAIVKAFADAVRGI